ncbi:hypothetical protein, partial [Novosphingobium sp.]|uniref:hypothetical protein n=1 Tax=Novosphingobium sp. TaxID=1874826 RepID=UPI0026255341
AIAREIDIDPLEIVLTRAANGDGAEGHGGSLFQICSIPARGARAFCDTWVAGRAIARWRGGQGGEAWLAELHVATMEMEATVLVRTARVGGFG